MVLSDIIMTPVQTGFQVRRGFRPKLDSAHKDGIRYHLIQAKDIKRGLLYKINQTGFEKGVTLEVFSSYNRNVKHEFSNTISIEPSGLDTLFIPEGKSKFMQKYLIQERDVLYLSKLHPGAFRYKGPIGRALPMSHFYILRPKIKGIDSDYLCWVLNQKWTTGPYIQKLIAGSVLPFISKADLLSFKIPLPTFSVQKKIVYLLSLRDREKQIQEQLDSKKNILLNKVLRDLL